MLQRTKFKFSRKRKQISSCQREEERYMIWRWHQQMRADIYNYRIVHYFMNVLNLPQAHVSATLMAILREVTYRGYITETSQTNAQI